MAMWALVWLDMVWFNILCVSLRQSCVFKCQVLGKQM